MNRWLDPVPDLSPANRLGPFSCGRRRGHKGLHAHDGAGASALWDSSGDLKMAVQVKQEQEAEE